LTRFTQRRRRNHKSSSGAEEIAVDLSYFFTLAVMHIVIFFR
jgi:hypothetical protein